MLFTIFTYLLLSLGVLAFLSRMILSIGNMMSDCPAGGPAARSAAITVATGFGAIGAGGVLLIGAVLPLFGQMPVAGLSAAAGFAALCLGLGFTQAIATLRAVLNPVADTPEEVPSAA